MKKNFFRSDWFAGLVISLCFVAADQSALVQRLENAAYDWGMTLTQRPTTGKVAIIAIDDESIANLGRWPWSRDIHTRLIDLLAKGQPKVIGHTVFFVEPQIDAGHGHLIKIKEALNGSALSTLPDALQGLDTLFQSASKAVKNGYMPENLQIFNKIIQFYDKSGLRANIPAEIQALDQRIDKAIASLDTDEHLGRALEKAGNVVLGIPFNLGNPMGKPSQEPPEYVFFNSLPRQSVILPEKEQPLKAEGMLPPIPALGEKAAAMGALNNLVDGDGGVRTIPMVIDYYDTYYPSMALQVAARSMNLEAREIQLVPGTGVRLGKLQVHTGSGQRLRLFYYQGENGAPPFPMDSFYDVISGKIPPEKYKDKIVLIGPNATGISSMYATPTSPYTAPVEILAHTITSILNEDFYVTPEWSYGAKMGGYLLATLFVAFLLPHLHATAAAILTLILTSGLTGTHLYLMTQQAWWLPLMGPVLLLTGGYLLMITRRFLVTERGKLRSDAESAESNRMLGLAFQGQGQLDMAFEKFRKCPLDDSMLEVLYNLGMDFERKRQFGKAVSVYQYMSDFNPAFRDIQQRMKRSTTLESTVVLGGGGGMAATSLINADGDIQKPMLGRYEIEKELGKGAMGIVYLGRDPKINRVVAIKTMSLAQEFDGDELQQVKSRFFREAESAGRLNHPNIVTVYDTGEEHDLAYIAMEFLKGHDLDRYVKKENLMPMTKVIQIIAKVAVALDYAHENNVVHRDIKPANIMYDPEGGSIKITDFGIARITDGGTKTKTGVVLGTPYYMSPEQVSGKRVDGRSDLFSLTVMFYQMLTGQLPFRAGDMASLLYQITQERHTDPRDVNPKIPPCMVAVLDKGLEKDPEQRYQRGSLMARDMVRCVQSLVRKPA